MDSMGTMRGIEQIQERDDAGNSSRLMSLALGGLALACVLFAVGVMVGRESGETRASTREDALDRLDRLDRATRATDTNAAMTWPERLTGPAPSNAPAPAAPGATAAATAPSPAAILGASAPVAPSLVDPTNRPVLLNQPAPPAANAAGLGIRMRDGTIPGAAPSTDAPANTTPAQPGTEGPFSVQVSSFRNLPHAQNFAAQLRQRGHHAFVAAPATDPNHNVWHRVRIGPFASQREANAFRVTFEQREHLPTIVVRREQNAPAARD